MQVTIISSHIKFDIFDTSPVIQLRYIASLVLIRPTETPASSNMAFGTAV